MRKKQFSHFEHYVEKDEYSYWHVEELNEWHLYKDKYMNFTMSSGRKCKSLRAFRRNLKRISKKQPELKGMKFILINKWYEVSKRGNKRSLDVIMKVK